MRFLAVGAALFGIAVWEAIIPSGSTKEAWDIPAYWQLAYPAMLVASGVFGAIAPVRPWRWPLAMFLGQGVWSILKSAVVSGISNLWPLGIVMFALLSVPAIAAAALGAWLARRWRQA